MGENPYGSNPQASDQVRVEDHGDRVSGSMQGPGPLGIPGTYVLNEDDVGDVRHATAPARLGGDDRSEWNVDTLNAAIEWLNAERDFLERNRTAMNDISDLMRMQPGGGGAPGVAVGGSGQPSPMGTFPWANQLSGQHAAAFSTVYSGLKEICDSLADAAQAAQRVLDNYETAEERNRMGIADMQRILGETAGPQGN
jgi:hypothetical protein